MCLAAATNFLTFTGNPDSPLKRLAEAGFTHVLWGHQWNTDFLYNPDEIAAVRKALHRNHLKLHDLHGSRGKDKNWFSEVEYERKAGVELVRNRLQLLAECAGSGVLVMHPPRIKADDTIPETRKKWKQTDALRRSLDELIPALDASGSRIALENLPGDTWEILRALLADYPAERIGVCLDAGHANLAVRPQWDDLKEYASRIIAVHLHDNDGGSDQHLPPGAGNVPWKTVLSLLKKADYRAPLTFEVMMQRTPWYDEMRPAREQTVSKIRHFLADAFVCCREIAEKYGETASPEEK